MTGPPHKLSHSSSHLRQKETLSAKKKTAKANGAGGDGSEGSDSDEPAVVVEVSFASDALVSLEDKE